ncbi:MAG: 16S rRNA (cytosine(1402)-N(4))-methyltransferase RsmH [Rickettsiales bacterium]|nr:16S rRNA (cytosine(1402)-N(4))-methyltransferase RsmH [Rickettsiales bacterium]
MYGKLPHIPVMRDEVLRYMQPADGEVYVDGTFGAGGHTRALLEAAKCRVIALDCDPEAKAFAEHLGQEFGNRLTFIAGRFGDMARLLDMHGVQKVNGVLLDIGVSSMQLDTPVRGFSFQANGPLDMRMEQTGRDAQSFINEADEEDIANVLYQYGDERASRRIAKSIVMARATKPITTTHELAEIIRKAIRGHKGPTDPATRSFQALRIWVNDELNELTQALETAEQLLLPEGRLVVITFHSGEDAIVKRFMNARSGKQAGVSRYEPLPPSRENVKTFSLLTPKAVAPGKVEIEENPRARSARLRAAVRIMERVQ